MSRISLGQSLDDGAAVIVFDELHDLAIWQELSLIWTKPCPAMLWGDRHKGPDPPTID